jgi:hypothetical protein
MNNIRSFATATIFLFFAACSTIFPPRSASQAEMPLNSARALTATEGLKVDELLKNHPYFKLQSYPGPIALYGTINGKKILVDASELKVCYKEGKDGAYAGMFYLNVFVKKGNNTVYDHTMTVYESINYLRGGYSGVGYSLTFSKGFSEEVLKRFCAK